jgi:hypothetical protein
MPARGLAQLQSALTLSVQQHEDCMDSLQTRLRSCADSAIPLRACIDDVNLLEAWSSNLARTLRYTDSDGHTTSCTVAAKMHEDTHPLFAFSKLRVPADAVFEGALQEMLARENDLKPVTTPPRSNTVGRCIPLCGGNALRVESHAYTFACESSKLRSKIGRNQNKTATLHVTVTRFFAQPHRHPLPKNHLQRVILLHVRIVDEHNAQAALLTSLLESRDGCTFAPQLGCKTLKADEFRWAVHVLGVQRQHHFLECATGGGGVFGAMAAATTTLKRLAVLLQHIPRDKGATGKSGNLVEDAETSHSSSHSRVASDSKLLTGPSLKVLESGVDNVYIFLSSSGQAVIAVSAWNAVNSVAIEAASWAAIAAAEGLCTATASSWAAVHNAHRALHEESMRLLANKLPPVQMKRTRRADTRKALESKLRVNVKKAVVECRLAASLPQWNVADNPQLSEQSNGVRKAISHAAAEALMRGTACSALLAATPSAAPPTAASIDSAVLRNVGSTTRFVGTDTLSQLRCADAHDLYHMIDAFACNVWQFTLPRPRPGAAEDALQAAAMVIEVAPDGMEALCSMAGNPVQHALQTNECHYKLSAESFETDHLGALLQVLSQHAEKILRWHLIRAFAAHVRRARGCGFDIPKPAASEALQLSALSTELSNLTVEEQHRVDLLWNQAAAGTSESNHIVQVETFPRAQFERSGNARHKEVGISCDFTFHINHTDTGGVLNASHTVTLNAVGRSYL